MAQREVDLRKVHEIILKEKLAVFENLKIFVEDETALRPAGCKSLEDATKKLVKRAGKKLKKL